MIKDPTTLLRRLNSYCTQTLEAAVTLCQTRAHSEVTIEHWLLKLLELGDSDLTVIARLHQLDLDTIWQALLSELEQFPRSVQKKPQLSRSLHDLMTSAWLIASLDFNSDEIRSIHLLKALQESPHWLKAKGAWSLLDISSIQLQNSLSKVLQFSDEANTTIQKVEKNSTVDQQLSDSITQNNQAKSLTTSTNNNDPHQQILERFTINLTQKAKAGQLDTVLGRDSEIRQMIDILSRRRKNNPILVGEPGVGKTALVEGLALRIAEGNVPKSLQQVELLVLDLGLLQAGAGVKGEFEQRLKNVISAVQNASVPILLFIDEAHTLIGAGNQSGGADAANLLKPALARGELRTIAATTWSEYKQYFERDAALERRFQMVKVDEPDDIQAQLMLRGLKQRYATYHNVSILESAIKAAVLLSRRYITGRQLPDKAVDLLDTAAARVRMSQETLPEALIQIKANTVALELEKEALLAEQALGYEQCIEKQQQLEQQLQQLKDKLQHCSEQYKKEKALADRVLTLRNESEPVNDVTNSSDSKNPQIIRAALQQYQEVAPQLVSLEVDHQIVAQVVAEWTGIPIESLLKDEQSDLLSLQKRLSERVIGQDEALTALVKSLQASKTGLTSEQKPLGVFLLLGSSGIGKTETALALAEKLFGGERSLVTINLSEYQEAHTVSQLKGSPPGYVGYGEGGILTEAVRRRPYSVILLDEVEKAHKDVLNLFYQVFDRGFMRDGEGREIDFCNTLIIMTSNLGSTELQAMCEYQEDISTSTLIEELRPILVEHFQAAFLSRFQTILYRPLDKKALRDIVQIKLNNVAKRLKTHYNLQLQCSDKLYEYLADSCLIADMGARNIDTLLNEQILPVLSQILLESQSQGRTFKTITLEFSEQDGIAIEVSDT